MSSELEVEEVKKSDRGEIEELSSNIWSGHDYIPEVFDRWLEEGGFICGRLDGKIVALAKHTRHRNDVLWLEGLRVHPEYQGKGLGRKMIEKQIQMVEDLDHSSLQFLTAEDKGPVRKVAEDLGFEVKRAYDYLRLVDEKLETVASTIEMKELERVSLERNAKEVTDFVFSSEEYQENEGQYMSHWICHDIEKDLLEEEINSENCYSIRENGGLKALIFLFYHQIHDTLSIPFASGPPDEIKNLMKFGVKLCEREDYSTFALKSASDQIVKGAEEIGLERTDRGRALLYER